MAWSDDKQPQGFFGVQFRLILAPQICVKNDKFPAAAGLVHYGLTSMQGGNSPGLQLLCSLPVSEPKQLLHGLHWLWVDAIGGQPQAFWAAAVLQTLPSSDFYLVFQAFLLTTNGPKCPHLQAHHFRKTWGQRKRWRNRWVHTLPECQFSLSTLHRSLLFYVSSL